MCNQSASSVSASACRTMTEVSASYAARLEHAEQLMWSDIWDSVSPDIAAEHGFERCDIGRVQATVSQSLGAVPRLNLVFGGAEDTDSLSRVLDWLQGKGVQHYVAVAPALPLAAAAHVELVRRGYTPGYRWMKFSLNRSEWEVIQADEPAHTGDGVEILRATAADGPVFGRILAEGFELPEWCSAMARNLPLLSTWYCYLALADGHPVGCAAMRVSDGVAQLGLAATLESARGRGCQSALLARRVRDAFELGCDVAALETGEQIDGRPSISYRNILRAGFSERYLRSNYVGGE